MSQFASQNPLVVLCGLVCLPPIATAIVGFYLGRFGLPFAISIRRRPSNVVPNDDV